MTSTAPQDQTADPATRVERDRMLITLLQDGERAWLLNESYRPIDMMWYADLLRQTAHGAWLYQRYAYDSHSRILHFRGERPVGEAELSDLRRKGTPLLRP